MRTRMMGMVVVAVVLAGCGGESPRGEGARSAAVDSGPQPTPALDSVGTTTNSDPGRSD